MNEQATKLQIGRVNKIIKAIGEGKVKDYLMYFFPEAELKNLTKAEAQKIITGLGNKISVSSIMGVYGRDIWSHN